MNHKVKHISNNEIASCEKYLSKMLKQDTMFGSKKQPTPRQYQEKFSQLFRQPILPVASQPQRLKPKLNPRTQSPIQKATAQLVNTMPKELSDGTRVLKSPKRRNASRSRSRSSNNVREAWGQILQSKKSGDKMSTFSSFDPLRTLHFLSKELCTKLRSVVPEEDELLQIVKDIQHTLKRIPPEVTTLLHNPQIEYAQSEISEVARKPTSTKICQTPPTLYQEDTERFQKIMEENTYRLEASCKQLEMVCCNLQNEKEMTEKELDEAKENVDLLCKKVKELEDEIEEISNQKIKELEEEKIQLQQQLERAIEEVNNNPTLNHLKKLVDELKKQKVAADETCNRLEYDMTILKMEKEKFATMLSVRDREVKEIQDEMYKIQEQVNKQLKKLNSEVIEHVNSVKALSDPSNGMSEALFLEIGDTTISSITTNESDKDTINIIKESPCGDAELIGLKKESHEDMLQKLKATNVELDLPSNNKEQEAIYEKLMTGLTPSMEAFLTAHTV